MQAELSPLNKVWGRGGGENLRSGMVVAGSRNDGSQDAGLTRRYLIVREHFELVEQRMPRWYLYNGVVRIVQERAWESEGYVGAVQCIVSNSDYSDERM